MHRDTLNQSPHGPAISTWSNNIAHVWVHRGPNIGPSWYIIIARATSTLLMFQGSLRNDMQLELCSSRDLTWSTLCTSLAALFVDVARTSITVTLIKYSFIWLALFAWLLLFFVGQSLVCLMTLSPDLGQTCWPIHRNGTLKRECKIMHENILQKLGCGSTTLAGIVCSCHILFVHGWQRPTMNSWCLHRNK